MKQGLLIIDVQNDYFEQGKMPLNHPNQALKQIKRLENYFEANRLPILYIQHIKEAADAGFFKRGTVGARLHPDLNVNEDSLIIEKHFPNSFDKTDLEKALKTMAVEQLVIIGMMTHMCVDSTTRASKELGYEPIVIADATATKSLAFNGREISAIDVQGAFLSALKNFAQVITATEFLSR